LQARTGIAVLAPGVGDVGSLARSSIAVLAPDLGDVAAIWSAASVRRASEPAPASRSGPSSSATTSLPDT
jgi:hypothetical protein